MNRALFAGLAALVTASITPRLLVADDATTALIKEFTGQSETQKRSPQQLEDDYSKAISVLLRILSGSDVAAQRDAAKQLEDMSYRAARPGAEGERLAICHALAKAAMTDLPPLARAWPIRELEVIGRGESVDALAKLMEDKEPLIRQHALLALQNNPDQKATDALRKKLSSAKGADDRVGLINALGYRRDAASVGALSKLLSAKEEAVAKAAAAALGRIGTPDAAAALAKNAKGAMDFADDAYIRSADHLAASGNVAEALRIYRELYAESAPQANRLAALRGLVMHLPENEALEIVVKALHSSDPEIAATAARLAAHLSGKAVTARLVAELKNLPPEMQARLITTLGDRNDPAARGAVTSAVANDDASIRVAAIDALGNLGDAGSVPLLAKIAAESDARAATAARSSLAKLGGNEIDPAILMALGKSEPPIRAELVKALAARRATPALSTLGNLATKDEDETVRVEAINAIGALGGIDALPLLIDILLNTKTDRDLKATESAAGTIVGRISDPEQRASALLEALPKASGEKRFAILRVLGRTASPRALAALRSAIKDESADVRLAAIRGMSEWPDDAVAGDLLAASKAQGPDNQRILALRGYITVVTLASKRPAAQTAKMLGEALSAATRPDEKKLALGALGNLQNLEALKQVEPYIDQQNVRNEAINAALKIAKAIAQRQPDAAASVANKVLMLAKDDATKRQANDVLRLAGKQPNP